MRAAYILLAVATAATVHAQGLGLPSLTEVTPIWYSTKDASAHPTDNASAGATRTGGEAQGPSSSSSASNGAQTTGGGAQTTTGSGVAQTTGGSPATAPSVTTSVPITSATSTSRSGSGSASGTAAPTASPKSGAGGSYILSPLVVGGAVAALAAVL